MTTNCLIEPLNSYKKRVFTLNDVGWPGAVHMNIYNPYDVMKIVQVAKECKGYSVDECQKHKEADKVLTVGFGHDAILAHAGTVSFKRKNCCTIHHYMKVI